MHTLKFISSNVYVFFLACIVFVGIILTVPHTTSAFTLQNISHTLSTQTVNENAVHTMSGALVNDIIAGDVLSFKFPSDFILSSITNTNISITYNSTSVSQSNWNATHTGSHIEIEFFTNLTAGGIIEVVIGTTPAIENPTTQGTYGIQVSNTNTSTQFIALPILRESDVIISAFVIGDPEPPSGGTGCIQCVFDEDESNNGGTISIDGFSHPGGIVEVYIDGNFITQITADDQAAFTITLNNITFGEQTITLIGYDSENTKSPLYSVGFSLGQQGLVALSPVVLAPTIYTDATRYNITKDETITIFGFAPPNALIDIYINDIFVGTTLTDDTGIYNLQVPVAGYEVGTHKTYGILRYQGQIIASFTESYTIETAETLTPAESKAAQNPLFDVLVTGANHQDTSSQNWLPYIIMASVGALLGLLYLLILLLWNKRDPYVDYYDATKHHKDL